MKIFDGSAIKTETVQFLDPGSDGSTVYWRGRVPLNELLQYDPYAQSRSIADQSHLRTLLYMIAPAMSFLLVFTIVFFSGEGPPSTVWMPAVLIAGIAGWEPGLLVAAVVHWFALRPQATWLFKRISVGGPAEDGEPLWRLEPMPPTSAVPHIEGRPFVIRDDFMKRVSQQAAMRFTFRGSGSKAAVIQFTSLVIIAVGLFALLFLANTMTAP